MYAILKESVHKMRIKREEDFVIKESLKDDKAIETIIGDIDDSNPAIDALIDKLPISIEPDVKITAKDISDANKDVDPTLEELAESAGIDLSQI